MHQLYAIRDNKTSSYDRPIMVPHVASLLRELGDAVNGEKKPGSFAAHPEDYELYHVGSFAQDTGTITPINPPVFIESMQNLKIKTIGDKNHV